MVWDPARVTPKPWESVLEFYRYVEDRNHDFQPLRRLVEHVASQPYAASIAGATSGTALLVAQHAEAEWAQEAIRIDVDLGGAVRFTFPQKRLVKAATFECEGPGSSARSSPFSAKRNGSAARSQRFARRIARCAIRERSVLGARPRSGGRPLLSLDDPAGTLQNAGHVRSLDALEAWIDVLVEPVAVACGATYRRRSGSRERGYVRVGDGLASGHDRRPLDHVGELPHVPRPVVRHAADRALWARFRRGPCRGDGPASRTNARASTAQSPGRARRGGTSIGNTASR